MWESLKAQLLEVGTAQLTGAEGPEDAGRCFSVTKDTVCASMWQMIPPLLSATLAAER